MGSVIAVCVLAVILLVPTIGATAAPASAAPSITAFGSMLVSPVDGRVFVTADDAVLVFDAEGVYTATISGIPGAAGMDIDSGRLYVASTVDEQVVEVNLATLAVEHVFDIGQPLVSIAVINGAIWFGASNQWKPLGRYDLATGAVVTLANYYEPAPKEVPGHPELLLIASGGQIVKVSTVAPYDVLGEIILLGYHTDEIAVSGDGTTVFTSDGFEVDVATMQLTGRRYRPGPGGGVSWSPGKGGVLATLGHEAIYVARQGQPGTTHWIDTPTSTFFRTVDLAPDGSKVYAMLRPASGATSWNLFVRSLAPTISEVVPGSVVAGVPTQVTVTGVGLGGTTAATVGGVSARFAPRSPHDLVVQMPQDVAAGMRTLSLSGPWGAVTAPVNVVANTGATLRGTVRRGSRPASGVTVTLSHATSDHVMVATSDGAGAYELPGIPYATDNRLTIHDPSGADSDQTRSDVALVPNQTTTVDVDLRTQSPPNGAVVNRVPLIPGEYGRAQDVAIDPATDRVFVANGDAIEVFDRDGRAIGRIDGQFGVAGLVVADGALYANVAGVAKVIRVDTTTLVTTGSWPMGRPTRGQITFAAGRIWFDSGIDQWMKVASLDPATGVVTETLGEYQPSLGELTGDASKFLMWDSGRTMSVVDATGTPHVTAQVAWMDGPVIGSATSGHVWSSTGREHELQTGAPTGVRYPGPTLPVWPSPTGFAPGRGGVLAFEDKIFNEGSLRVSQTLPDKPQVLALEPSGLRAVAVNAANELVITDLRPEITRVGPSPMLPGSTSATIFGTGVANASTVQIDGVARTFTRDEADASKLIVATPPLAEGTHEVVVTTPIGTSPVERFVVSDGAGFHSLAPTRILDSRSPLGGWGAKLVAGAPRSLQVGGAASVPSTASAVVVNLTATNGTAGSYLAAWPSDVAPPVSSTLNFAAGQTIANLATVKLSSSGSIMVKNAVGSVDVVADVVGYYDDGTGPGDLFTAVAPNRQLDTRAPGGNGPLVSGTAQHLQIAGRGSVPSTATAAVVNVTATGSTAGSFVSVWPTGAPKPTSSTVNFGPGQTIPNSSVVKLGTQGAIDIANAVGATDVVIDVVGYYDSSGGSRFHALSPTRILDGRSGLGLPGPFDGGVVRSLTVAPNGSMPVWADGLVANITATGSTAGSFVTVYPTGLPRPTSSNLNFGPGETIANLSTLGIPPTGAISFVNHLGSVHLVADAVGYFAPA